MRWVGDAGGWCVVWSVGMALAGCAASTRMAVEPTTEGLSDKKRGVAVMKFVMPLEMCEQHSLFVGTRDGQGHRLVRKLSAAGRAPATTANAAEVELEPGEYQVLGYHCRRARSIIAVGNEGGPHTSSLGRFTVGAGEVVNIGQISFRRVSGSTETKVAVADWSLADLNRYRDERPKLFAGMQTRLLDLSIGKPPAAAEKDDRCGQLATPKAAGKIAQLPQGCS